MVDTYRTLGNPIDERTAALNLPLPNRLNDSRDDVGRLRVALELIDTAMQLMGLDMDSRDDALAAADQALAARAVHLSHVALQVGGAAHLPALGVGAVRYPQRRATALQFGQDDGV